MSLVVKEIKVDIKKEFRGLKVVLEGPEYAKQFLIDQGRVVCTRESCEGCPLFDICENHEEEVYVGLGQVTEGEITQGILPHVRRAIAFESAFIQLRLKPEFKSEEGLKRIPDKFFKNPHVKYSLLHEENRHYLLQKPVNYNYNPEKGVSGLFLVRDQARFYSSNPKDMELAHKELEESGLLEYFDFVQDYEPFHYVASCDVSAEEPLFSTMAIRRMYGGNKGCAAYDKVFDGELLDIYRQVEFSEEEEPKND